ncbi:MAG: PL29 family lyase N-terminal domain-containing protein [Candidatus Cryptobacteroides sp.]|nr:PL29 family lyase N-terminal domain-containing protein [Candidatus Cryptobacteroides sp.]
MKKQLLLCLAAAALTVGACYNDKDLVSRLDQHDKDIAGLQKDVKDLQDAVSKINSNIEGLDKIVKALEKNVYVKSVTDVKDTAGDVIGYTIEFTDNSKITIYHGEDGNQGDKGDKGDKGDQGDKGDKGDKGDAPVIGVKESGGIYYWTLNGEFLVDGDGHPIPVTGNDGQDGATGATGADGITPQFRINEGNWEVSYDGQTWEVVGPAQTAAEAVDAVFSGVKETKDQVVFTLADGTKLAIDKLVEFSLKIDDTKVIDVVKDATTEIPYTLVGVGSGTSRVDAVASGDWWAEVEAADAASGTLKVTAGDEKKAKVIVYAVDGKGRSDIRSLVFNGGTLTATAPVSEAPTAGGDLEVPVVTNVDYTVVIEEAAQYWLSYAITKAGEVRNEKIVFSVEKNDTPATRSATVEIKDMSGAVIQSFTVKQESGVYEIPTFEDSSFKNYILYNSAAADYNENLKVDASEAAKLTELKITSDYTSLKGIECFYNLKKITISATAKLESLDLSKNKQLQEVTISKSYGTQTVLTSLDLSDLHALKTVQIGGMTAIETLKLGSAPALTGLYAYNTALTELDVTGCPALEGISCYGAKLAALDLSKNTKLTSATVGCSTLKSLTLPEEPLLTSLSVDNAAFTSLDLSKLTKLTSFAAAATQMETIDLSNSPLLTSFSVGSYGTGASTTLKVVDMRKSTKLTSVNLYSSVLEEVIVPKGTKTSSWNWTGTHMDPDTGAITTVKVTEVEVEGEEEPEVDDYAAGIAEPFVKKIILGKYDKDGDGAIDAAEAEAVTELDFSECGLEDGDLKGLEVFPIEKLILDGNKFTSFDVLAWPKLAWLSLNKNKLTELSIGSSYTALNQNLHLEAASNKITKFTGPSYYAKVNYLDLSDNQLTGSFNMPYNSNLEYIDLSHNSLTGVTLTSASNVKVVNVSYNALASVAFSGFSKLEKVDASSNKLTAYTFSASQTALADVNLANNNIAKLDITSVVKSAALKKIDLSGNGDFALLIIGSGNTLPETLEIVADTEYAVFAASNPTKELTYNRYSYISGVELGENAKEIDLTVNYATGVKAFEVPAGSTLTITSSGNRKALRLFALGIGGKPTVTVSRADEKKVYNHSDNNYCSENPYTCAENSTYKNNGVVIDGDGDNILYFFGPTTGSSSGGLVDGDKVVLTVSGNAGESVLIVGLNLETYTTDDYGWM